MVGENWPALSAEFGLLPWHVGGDPYLTFREIEWYQHGLQSLMDQRRQAAERNKG